MSGNKRQFQRLWKQSHNCHWCGKLMREEPRQQGGQLPLDTATIDHIVHTYDRTPGQKGPVVLACYECNRQRGMERDLEFYYGERRGQRTDMESELVRVLREILAEEGYEEWLQ